MRARPIRPNIYLPVVRFGVADSDWFTVLLISCAGYLAPVAFGMTVFYVPLQMWTWLLATAGSIAFFNYIRIGRRPQWLQHKLSALVRHHRDYRYLPAGKRRRFRDWLNNTNMWEVSPANSERVTATALLIDTHRRFQETCEERWNLRLLTTN